VARTIGRHIDDYRIVANKSTVPVGTADSVKAAISAVLDERGLPVEFAVVSNLEFLKEGAAVEDFMKPDRIIVGTDNPRTADLLRGRYNPFSRNHDRMIVMDVRSAELTKYAANAMLATKISFMNELANLAEHIGADVEQVRIGIGSDPRIGYEFDHPGCGFGGSCSPRTFGHSTRPPRASVTTPRFCAPFTRRQKHVLFEKIKVYFRGALQGKVVALWGLAFQTEYGDMREASSRVLMEALWEAGATVRSYDPAARDEAQRIYGSRKDLVLCEHADEALVGAGCLAIVTEWREFRSPDVAKLKGTLREPFIFDGRNLYDPKLLRHQGFRYFAIARRVACGSLVVPFCASDQIRGRLTPLRYETVLASRHG
jgi:UDPglucose 6-dehydrogenase